MLDQNQEKQVLDLYQQGWSRRKIAMYYNVSDKPIRRVLCAAGVALRNQAQHGESNYFWKGGRHIDKDGYILVYSPQKKHPVREHRLIMEKKLGRPLTHGEVVDHKNGVKNDNRPSNLVLYPTNAAHLAATLKGRCPKWSEDGQLRIVAATKAARFRRKIARSILGAVQLRRPSGHRCTADTCPLYEIRREHLRARQRVVARAWRIRRKELRRQTAA